MSTARGGGSVGGRTAFCRVVQFPGLPSAASAQPLPRQAAAVQEWPSHVAAGKQPNTHGGSDSTARGAQHCGASGCPHASCYVDGALCHCGTTALMRWALRVPGSPLRTARGRTPTHLRSNKGGSGSAGLRNWSRQWTSGDKNAVEPLRCRQQRSLLGHQRLPTAAVFRSSCSLSPRGGPTHSPSCKAL